MEIKKTDKYKHLLNPLKDADPNKIKFKLNYINGCTKILKETFPNNWRDESDSQLGGVYSLTNNERSLLNNLNSSYSAFELLVKFFNNLLNTEGKKLIHFGLDDTLNLIALDYYFETFSEHKDKVLKMLPGQDYGILNELKELLEKTKKNGDANEVYAAELINKKFGNESCIITSSVGCKDDAYKGIDAYLTLNGKNYTAQIKGYSVIHLTTKESIIRGSSNPKIYNTDAIIFVNCKKKMVNIYENKESKVHNLDYYFKHEYEIDIIQGY